MIRRIISGFLFFVFISLPYFLIAQENSGTFSGKVVDAATLLPMENVNIVISGTRQGAASDLNGNFSITGLKSGNHVAEASITGYEPERIKIYVKSGGDTFIRIEMHSQSYPIDSIVVSAQKEVRSLLKAPYTEPYSLLPTINRISSDVIRKQGAITVIDALNFVPGSLTESRGRQVKQFFSVRGQKYPYPDYAVNGVWQQEFQELPYFFSASDIEEIEIVRSSAALLTGLSGLSGLVNIKTRKCSVPELRADLEYGSFNSIHGHASAGGKSGTFSYRAGVGFDKTSGPEGKHAAEEMANLNTDLEWQVSDQLQLQATLFFLDGQRQLRMAEPPADKKYLNMLQSFDPYQSLISNAKAVYRPSTRLSSEFQLFYTYRNPTFNDEVTVTKSNEKDSETGLNFMQSVVLGTSNTLRFGGLYNRWIAPNGKRFYIGKRCDTETFSGVLADEQQIGRVTLDAGIRWTKTLLNEYAAFNIEGEGGLFKNVRPITDTWEPGIFQGSMGAAWRLNHDLAFFINSAAGQIAPRRGALNENMQELKNESRLKVDLGMTKKIGNTGKLSLVAFSVVQDNGIVLSGLTWKDPSTNIVRELYANRDQFQRGIECEVDAPLILNLIHPFLNFTLMKSKMDKENEMVINKENPVFITNGGFYLTHKAIDLNMWFKYVSAFENERFASATAGPQPLGDFLSFDLTGGYTLKNRIPLRFYIKIRNAADTKYSTVIGYPDYGRMIYLGMNLNLQFKPQI